MKKNLFIYCVYAIINLIATLICFKYMVKSVIEIDYLGSILWSLLFSFELDSFINKHRNFVRYYPNFEDKWIDFF